jgi:hypothetical protein
MTDKERMMEMAGDLAAISEIMGGLCAVAAAQAPQFTLLFTEGAKMMRETSEKWCAEILVIAGEVAAAGG